jgi:transcriptional regulator with XRE-family HTH domain
MQRTPFLRALRERAALSQKDLAELSGVARATIADLETGKRPARPSTLRKVAQGLGVEVTDLYEGPEVPRMWMSVPPSQATLFNGQAEEERCIAYLRAWRVFLEDRAREWRADGEELLQDEEPNDAGAVAWAITNRQIVDSIRNKVLREFATGAFPPEDSAEFQELMAVCDAIDRVTEITHEFMRHVALEVHKRAKAQETAADCSKVEDLAKFEARVRRAREEMRERTKALNRELTG